MTAAILKHHQPGARVSIVTAGGMTLPGTVEGTEVNIFGDWPTYRLNVIDDDGRPWRSCHPDCILPLESAA